MLAFAAIPSSPAAIVSKTIYSEAELVRQFTFGTSPPRGFSSATNSNYSFSHGNDLRNGNAGNAVIYTRSVSYQATINPSPITEVDISAAYDFWIELQSFSADPIHASFYGFTEVTFTLDAPGVVTLSKAGILSSSSGNGYYLVKPSLIIDNVEWAGAPGNDEVILSLGPGTHTARIGANVAMYSPNSEFGGGGTVRLNETFELNISALPEPGSLALAGCAGAFLLQRRARGFAIRR